MISEDEIDSAIKNNNILIIKFTADWCESCKKYDEYINTLNLPILSIDYDLNEDLIEEYEIKKLPTIIIYKNKNFLQKIENFITKTDFLKLINNI